jgi:hypothetical protein
MGLKSEDTMMMIGVAVISLAVGVVLGIKIKDRQNKRRPRE